LDSRLLLNIFIIHQTPGKIPILTAGIDQDDHHGIHGAAFTDRHVVFQRTAYQKDQGSDSSTRLFLARMLPVTILFEGHKSGSYTNYFSLMITFGFE